MNFPAKSLSPFEQVTTARERRAPATVIDWGLELRLWVATCVTGLSLFSARALGLAFDGTTTSALGIIFFATLALYNLDGSLDAPKAPIRHSGRAPEWRAAPAPSATHHRRRRLHLALTGLASIALLVLAARLSLRALLLTGGGALICSLYAIPLTLTHKSRGGSRRSVRLKALPFLKAPFVGCAVGTAVVWVPLWASDGRVLLPQALVLTSALSLYCCTNALLFDLPDVGEDKHMGVPTLPLRWGLQKMRWAGRALTAAGLICSAVFSAIFGSIAPAVGLLCLGAALLAFTELFHFRTPRRTVAVWVDGALLLPLGFQLLLSI